MRAAVISDTRRIELVERVLPAMGTDQVRVRIEQCGLCASELDLWTGKAPNRFPAPIGHEIAGVVEAVGSEVKDLQVGDRVAAWIDEGGFAEEAIVDQQHCVSVGPDVSYPAVAEPLACVVNAVELAAPRLGDDVAIIGAGYMGILIQLVTALKGPRSITVIDTRQDALERASALGATRVINPNTESAKEVIGELTEGGADVTYEVTGVNAGIDLAADLTRMNGKLAIVGFHQGGPRTIQLSHWNWMAFDVVNAHFRQIEQIMAGMRAGMRLVNARVIDVSELVTAMYPLESISEAFELAETKPDGFLKALVTPNGVAT